MGEDEKRSCEDRQAYLLRMKIAEKSVWPGTILWEPASRAINTHKYRGGSGKELRKVYLDSRTERSLVLVVILKRNFLFN